MTRCQSCSESSHELPVLTIPALLTATWRAPNRSMATATDAVDSIRITDIGGHGVDLAALVTELGSLRLQAIFVHVGHHHPHALGDERPRRWPARSHSPLQSRLRYARPAAPSEPRSTVV